MRGLFTAGVLDVFLEEGIGFDGAVGVSAGAAFGCNLKSEQKGRVLRYNTRFCRDKRYCSLRSLLLTGSLYGADFCYRRLPEELDLFDWKRYEENPMAFFALCTDAETGKPVGFSCEGEKKRVMKIFQASASMPFVSKMVEIDGKQYLDGGIASSIPLWFLEERGYEKNVVVLTQPRDYIKGENRFGTLMKVQYARYPALCRAMAQRHLTYRREQEEIFAREKEGKAFVIAPASPLPVGRVDHNPENLRAAWRIGQEEAKKRLEELNAFLQSK